MLHSKLQCRLLTSDILYERTAAIFHTLLTAEPSKGPKSANNSLTSTWNITRCKESLFLFSLCLLPISFHTYTSCYMILECVSIAHALLRIRIHAYYIHAEGLALQCFSFSLPLKKTAWFSIEMHVVL